MQNFCISKICIQKDQVTRSSLHRSFAFRKTGKLVIVILNHPIFTRSAMKKEQLLKKLGTRIREIRKEKGITQVELANSIGKDQQLYNFLKEYN